jgi:rubredoxin
LFALCLLVFRPAARMAVDHIHPRTARWMDLRRSDRWSWRCLSCRV